MAAHPNADALARLGLAAVRALGAGHTPTAGELRAVAEADTTLQPGRLTELTRDATAVKRKLDSATGATTTALSLLATPDDDLAGPAAAASKLLHAAVRLGRETSAAAELPDDLARYAEAVEAGVAVASYCEDETIQRCPGKGDRSGTCGGVTRRGWKLCASCHGQRSVSRANRT